MKMTNKKSLLSFIVCIVLVAAIALFATGCGDNSKTPTPEAKPSVGQTQDVKAIGKGKLSFAFTVADMDGNQTQFKVSTDKTTVGEALQEVGLIEGEMGEYGLFVKTVNGITAPDDTYWAFYLNDGYAPAGVDQTPIKSGETYSLKLTKI